jgi:DNA-binding response OmpR family regulator
VDILVIEDSDSIARMIEALVVGRGHAVRTAVSGAVGVDLALERPPDVVLLDWSLAGSLSSAEICARLQRDDATRDAAILVLGDADDEAKSRALDAGAMAYYTKPFSPLALLKEIEGLRARSSGRMRARRSGRPMPPK